MAKSDNALAKLSSYHIVILVLFLLFFLITFLAGVLLIVKGKGDGVWKLLMCGSVGSVLAIKVIATKYAKNKNN
jgi:hypothetical protein